MFLTSESENEYRFGDSGPKYLMRGPRSNFAVVQLQPGQDFKAHYHDVMEENFFILEGEVEVVVDGAIYPLKQGDFFHVEPGEIHYLINRASTPVKMTATLAPYRESDKTDVENYTY